MIFKAEVAIRNLKMCEKWKNPVVSSKIFKGLIFSYFHMLYRIKAQNFAKSVSSTKGIFKDWEEVHLSSCFWWGKALSAYPIQNTDFA